MWLEWMSLGRRDEYTLAGTVILMSLLLTVFTLLYKFYTLPDTEVNMEDLPEMNARENLMNGLVWITGSFMIGLCLWGVGSEFYNILYTHKGDTIKCS